MDNEITQEILQCRICLEDEENMDLLISPCRCNGTSKYVHITCLRTWRYQSISAPAFYKCMECNEDYIILNNDEIENEIIFDIFNTSDKLLYFELGVSFFLNIFIYTFDVFVNDYSLVNIFPGWYNNTLSEIVKGNTFYQNLFYINFSIYIHNFIFVLIYILRCCLYVKNKRKLSYLMTYHIIITLIYYNSFWWFMLAMGSYNMYEFALMAICIYEVFSYKLNFEIIKKHNVSIRIMNESLDTGVASMYNNPLNIIVDPNLESDTDSPYNELDDPDIKDDSIQLLS